MLTFSTRYDCPTKFLAGGGNGTYGLCAMEAISVLTGEYLSDPKPIIIVGSQGYVEELRPYVNVSSVHPALRDILVSANDSLTAAELSGEDRADGLWPILPSVMNTGHIAAGIPVPEYPSSEESFKYNYLRGFPLHKWADGLGEELPNGPWTNPMSVLRQFAFRAEHPTRVWERILIATKSAIEVFWEEFPNELRRSEFTEREIANLNGYLLDHPNAYTLREDRRVPALA